MKASPGDRLPLPPLLHCYQDAGLLGVADLGRLPGLGPRFKAILSATASFLYDDFLDQADDQTLADALGRFYEACVVPPLHADRLRARVRLIRFGLGHLLRGEGTPASKLAHCLEGGPYHVPGLGPVFWNSILQGLKPTRAPAWTPATLAGLRRLGLAEWSGNEGPAAILTALQQAQSAIRRLVPEMNALHCEHFLSLVGQMQGRDLWSGSEKLTSGTPGLDLEAALRRERARRPLREMLRQRGQELAEAQQLLEQGLARQDGATLGRALLLADPDGRRAPLNWDQQGQILTLWVGRLWESDDPYATLEQFWAADPIPGAGLWLPAAVLHLRDPQNFGPWSDRVRAGHARLEDAIGHGGANAESYRCFNESLAWLRRTFSLHPLQVPGLLASLAEEEVEAISPTRFGGFCGDTFRFLRELGENNDRAWMEQQRQRYHFAVRQPLLELCRALAERYVEPVLVRGHGWELETTPETGLALTSVCKNNFGRAGPYATTLWVVFGRKSGRGTRGEAQFFVRLDARGVRYGVRLAPRGKPAQRALRQTLSEQAEELFEHLRQRGAWEHCRLHWDSGPAEGLVPESVEDFRSWLAGKELIVARGHSTGSALLRRDDLVGDVLLTFDRLAPLYARAVGAKPPSPVRAAPRFDEADFCRLTHLGSDWLARARGLLQLKRQLILQGVPGTGKTHVARCLARLLTGDDPASVRLVQFHPAYSYEEFVEGIKVRSVEVNGRHDVTYPVEDGLLCSFAALAQARPAQPHVLIIDEINRGNLPRVFGELLYLLEYREQEVPLPYSRRAFRLPQNLYLIGTMNAADRSVALIDQALRRRFSFLEMPPDPAVLASWLARHPPSAGSAFAARVVTLFGRLNERLRQELGPQYQVGHSYFMVPGLDEELLQNIWAHQVRPLLEEHSASRLGASSCWELEDFLLPEGRKRRSPAGTA